MAAYQRLAHDIITAIPEQFAPQPVSADMIDWFWRHNAWRGVFNNPYPAGLPQTSSTPPRCPPRFSTTATNTIAAAASCRCISSQPDSPPLPSRPASWSDSRQQPLAVLSAAALLAWTAGLRRIPSWSKTLRVSSPEGAYPDSYQAILPVVDMPKAGIVFPDQNFCKPSTTSTPAPPSTSPSTS